MMSRAFESKNLVRVIVFFIVFFIYFSIFNFPLSANAESDKSDRVIVSLGDSFSSGEGIEPFYDQDLDNYEKVESLDWLAHRSKKAWSGQLVLKDENGNKILMSENRNTNWYFAAVSGAETKHLKSQQYKPYNKSFGLDASTDKGIPLPPQIDVLYDVKKEYKKIDYVTLTLGGNDVGFTEVIKKVAIESFYVTPTNLYEMIKSKIEMLNGKTGENLEQAYKDIYMAAGRGTQIIVAGYPQLFCSVNASQKVVGQMFSVAERIIINQSVNFLNNKIGKIVQDLNESGFPIHYVSVKEEFDGHEAYSLFPYINPVYLTPKPQDIDDRFLKDNLPNVSSYSMHPNENGARAYARCVQKKIDALEKKSNQKPTSTDEYFYQLQQYNMWNGLTMAYDKNAIYYYAGRTEFGHWIRCTDSIDNLEPKEVYSGNLLIATPFNDKEISFNSEWSVAINFSQGEYAVCDDYIYYIRDGALYRNPIKFSSKMEAKNSFFYYNEEYKERSISFVDEKIFDLSELVNGSSGEVIGRFILSKEYIYIIGGSNIIGVPNDKRKIIRMRHDGSGQTTIMTEIDPSNYKSMYTIENDMYFICDGALYCNYEASNESVAVCEVGTNVELMEALGDTLYFQQTEEQASNSYVRTVYKYTQGDTELTKLTEIVVDACGDVFVDPNGAVLFFSYSSGKPTYFLENGIMTEEFCLYGRFIYKNTVYGLVDDGKKLVPIFDF